MPGQHPTGKLHPTPAPLGLWVGARPKVPVRSYSEHPFPRLQLPRRELTSRSEEMQWGDREVRLEPGPLRRFRGRRLGCRLNGHHCLRHHLGSLCCQDPAPAPAPLRSVQGRAFRDRVPLAPGLINLPSVPPACPVCTLPSALSSAAPQARDGLQQIPKLLDPKPRLCTQDFGAREAAGLTI